VAQVLLDSIQIDREHGIYMLDEIQKWISTVCRNREVSKLRTYEEYIAERGNDLGIRYGWAYYNVPPAVLRMGLMTLPELISLC